MRRGARVAFESIDGAPRPVFHKLVQNLSAEAAARAVPVVSRHGAADYRIRGYLAAQLSGGKATYSWVWDIYDRDQNRARRITGQQSTGASGDDPWAAVDESVARVIARASMERVAAFLGADAPAPAVPPVSGDRPTNAVAAGRRPNRVFAYVGAAR